MSFEPEEGRVAAPDSAALQCAQVGQQIADGLVALAGPLGQALADEAFEINGQSRSDTRERFRRLVENRIEDGLFVMALKWQLAACHLVEHDAERPDVGPRVDFLASGLLRGHIGRCADRGPFLGELRAAMGKLSQPEVHQNGLAVSRHHDVGRVDVAVDDAFAVRFLEAPRCLFGEIEQALDFQRPRLDFLRQFLPVEIGHGDKRLPVDLVNLVKTVQMLGCCSAAAALASRMKRRRLSSFEIRWAARNFSATIRSSFLSTALVG